MKKIFDKRTDIHFIKTLFRDEMQLMFGGFGGVGNPPALIDALIDSGAKDVHLIGTDAGFPEVGIGKFIVLGRAKSMITTHIGSNPIAGKLMTDGLLDIEFVPQGTFAERLRHSGSGLNGFLTKVGLGTQLQYNKPIIEIDGEKYLYERPLSAVVGIVYAKKADTFGNLVYDKTARNTNPLVAMASKITIVEAEEIVEVGELDPETIITPGIFVDYIIQSTGINWKWAWETKEK